MKKKFMKKAAMFAMAVSLSTSIFTGCGSDDKSSESKVEKATKKPITIESIASDIEKSMSELKFDGTGFKVLADINSNVNGVEYGFKLDGNIQTRINPAKLKLDMSIETNGENGTSTTDTECYVFMEDGKLFVEMMKKDGTYVKSPIDVEQFKGVIDSIPEQMENKEIFTAEQLTSMKDFVAGCKLGEKKTVAGKEYNVVKKNYDDATVRKMLSGIIDMALGYANSQEQTQQFTSGLTAETLLANIPVIEEGVDIELYFSDAAVLSGVGVDVSKYVAAMTSSADAKVQTQIMFNFGNTEEIAIPDAELVDMSALME